MCKLEYNFTLRIMEVIRYFAGAMLTCFLLIPGSITAQTKIDSLIRQIDVVEHDTTKVNLMIEVARAYYDSSFDISFKWYEKAATLAKSIKGDSVVNYRAQIQLAESFQSKAWLYIEYTGNYDSAFILIDEVFNIYKKTERNTPWVKASVFAFNKGQVFNTKGTFYFYQGEYDKAIENYQKAVVLFERSGFEQHCATMYLNIGNIFIKQKSYEKAIEYYTKSMEIKQKYDDQKGIANTINNIGTVYYYKKDYPTAIEYFKKSLKIREELGEMRSVSKSYNNIGVLYRNMGDFKSAIHFYKKSLELKKQIGDKSGMVTLYGNLVQLYQSLALSANSAEERNSCFLKAKDYGSLAMEIANELQALPGKLYAVESLKELYKSWKKPTKALRYAEEIVVLKDSMFSDEKTRAIAEMETKYQSEKKEQEIEKQKLLLAKEKAISTKKNFQRNAFVAGFILMLVVALVVIRSNRQRKRANMLIREKNDILEQANAEISAQRDEIESQRDEIEAQRDYVTRQKEEIELKNKEITFKNREITDSITYARRIQEALLPSEKLLETLFPEHFVLFRPRDIVSGDFYWTAEVGGKAILATGDCTGHGVPGAFMSLLGISYLNEIVIKNQLTNPGEILNRLRGFIINALHQKNKDIRKIETKDGIDIAIYVVHSDEKKIEFAGARNSLYVVREQTREEQEGTVPGKPENAVFNGTHILQEYKANRMPVGIHVKNKPFDTQVILIDQPALLYTFSDGFMDQFGGSAHKKFMSKAFKELILSLHNKNMPEQKESLNQKFDDWMNASGEKQGDDVVVVGVKVG